MDGLSFVIRDRAGDFVRHVAAHRSATADLIWNDVSWSSFTLDDDDRALADVLAPGARADVLLNGVEEFRGRISSTPGAGPSGHVTAYVQSDMRKMRHWLGWQKPTAAITAQSDEYRRYSGKLETVVKSAIQETITRLGVPWAVVPSAGRGPDVVIDFRMDPLGDKILPKLIEAQFGLVISYPGGVPTVDVRSPETVAGQMDASSGRLDKYDFSRVGPEATRVVVGGAGEGVDRKFALVVDSAREADWGDIIEVFKDSRSLKAADDLTPDGLDMLAEGAPRTSISMELVEQPSFRYRTTYELGDLLPIRVGEVASTEVIRKIAVSDNAADGLTITPSVGEVSREEVAKLANQFSRLERRMKQLGRR